MGKGYYMSDETKEGVIQKKIKHLQEKLDKIEYLKHILKNVQKESVTNSNFSPTVIKEVRTWVHDFVKQRIGILEGEVERPASAPAVLNTLAQQPKTQTPQPEHPFYEKWKHLEGQVVYLKNKTEAGGKPYKVKVIRIDSESEAFAAQFDNGSMHWAKTEDIVK